VDHFFSAEVDQIFSVAIIFLVVHVRGLLDGKSLELEAEEHPDEQLSADVQDGVEGLLCRLPGELFELFR